VKKSLVFFRHLIWRSGEGACGWWGGGKGRVLGFGVGRAVGGLIKEEHCNRNSEEDQKEIML
jgi:hypothetical protein